MFEYRSPIFLRSFTLFESILADFNDVTRESVICLPDFFWAKTNAGNETAVLKTTAKQSHSFG